MTGGCGRVLANRRGVLEIDADVAHGASATGRTRIAAVDCPLDGAGIAKPNRDRALTSEGCALAFLQYSVDRPLPIYGGGNPARP